MTKYSHIGNEFEIFFHLIGHELQARVEGPHDSFEISCAYWRVVAQEILRTGATHILIEENLRQSGIQGEVLPLADQFIKMGLKGKKIAFVDSSDANRSEEEEVALIMREHGIHAAVLSDVREALNWLRYGEE